MQDQKWILREFYDIVACLLTYKSCEMRNRILYDVARWLCDISGCGDALDSCWEGIQRAKDVETCADAALMTNADQQPDSWIELKIQALNHHKIHRQSQFDLELMCRDLHDKAYAGQKNACKLLAVLHHLGIGSCKAPALACKLWHLLAMDGDLTAMLALQAACEPEEARKWGAVRSILLAAKANFSPFAMEAEHPGHSREEIRLANMILLMAQRKKAEQADVLPIPMLYYALYSRECYEVKLARLSENQNYYLLMQQEVLADRKFGF